MLTSHALLLKFRYDVRYGFSKVRVWYVDRGAPGDCSFVDGPEIALDKFYFEVVSSSWRKYIPYHRIRSILYAGVPVWEWESRK